MAPADINMTRDDLASAVASNCSLTKAEAVAVVETTLEGIVDALKVGEKVELRGFGSFCFRQRRAGPARNPKTGETVQVPAKKVAYFKPGKGLKELINS